MDKPADDTKCKGEDFVGPGSTDVYVQLAISLTMGLSAFLSFCVRTPPPSHPAVRVSRASTRGDMDGNRASG